LNNRTNNTIQALWIGIGSISSFTLGIASVAILSRYFGKSEYGTYQQILYVYNTLLIIFSAGLPRVFSYYLPKYSVAQGKTVVWKISKILVLFGLVFSIFLYISSEFIARILNNPDLSIGLKYFSPIPLFLLPTLGIEGIFSTYKKTIFIAIYNILTRILMLLFIVMPVILFRGSYLNAIHGWIIVSIISFIIAYYFRGIPFKNVKKEETTLTLKEILAYSLPLLFASLAGIATKSADQFYISRYFGTKVFAEFANGFFDLPLVTTITGATSIVLMPIFSKIFHKNGEMQDFILTWRRALQKSALLIYPLVVFFIVYAKEIMTIIYSQKYEASARYFQINMFLNFFNIVIFAPLFFSMGRTRVYSNVHIIIAIIVWLLDFVIIKIFNNPVAIAVSSTIINISKIIYFIYLASKLLNLNFLDFFPVKYLIKLLLHSMVIVSFIKLIQIHLIFIDSIFIKITILSILYIILLLLTAPFIKINYLSVLYPVLKKVKR
jgi:O-antigen/teichoic acid export membrane protein